MWFKACLNVNRGNQKVFLLFSYHVISKTFYFHLYIPPTSHENTASVVVSSSVVFLARAGQLSSSEAWELLLVG